MERKFARARRAKAAVEAEGARSAPKTRARAGSAGADAGKHTAKAPDLSAISGAKKAPMLSEVAPELATLADEAPRDGGWVYELKYDGYRVLTFLEGGKARFVTRNGKDWTEQFVALADAVEGLPVEGAVLDGEVAVLQPGGTTDFQALQNALRGGKQAKLVYFVFDLLYLDGYDLRGASLRDRKAALAALFERASAGKSDRGNAKDGLFGGRLRYSDHLEGEGALVHKKACMLELEGVVAKRLDSKYRGGRGKDWLKLKCGARQEVVIVGYTDPGGSRTGLGALLLGVHEKDGGLRYAGKVGTGFTEKSLAELSKRLRAMEQEKSPFDSAPRISGAHWVKAELVAEIAFAEWTAGGHMRHPSFLGLREDRRPVGIVREVPQHVIGAGAGEPKASGDGEKRVGPKGAGEKSAASKPKKAAPQGSVEIEGVTLSKPDKVLYPDRGLTKLDVARYYERIARYMLPHITDRPLTLVRCPDGQKKHCFFQKHASEGMPPAVKMFEVKEKDGPEHYLYLDSVAGLLSIVQMGVLELHVWGSRIDRVEQPDRLIFDLDPAPELTWDAVVRGAKEVRDRLASLGLTSFVKTTGGKGLHVVVPIARGRGDWDEMKAFTKAFATTMAGDSPSRYTATMSKAKRTDKIFIDYLRNARGATAACAFTTRNKPNATVATPISWEELDEGISPADFTVETVPARLDALPSDPWEELASVRQSITAAMKQRVGLR